MRPAKQPWRPQIAIGSLLYFAEVNDKIWDQPSNHDDHKLPLVPCCTLLKLMTKYETSQATIPCRQVTHFRLGELTYQCSCTFIAILTINSLQLNSLIVALLLQQCLSYFLNFNLAWIISWEFMTSRCALHSHWHELRSKLMPKEKKSSVFGLHTRRLRPSHQHFYLFICCCCYETMSNCSQNCWTDWNSAVLCFNNFFTYEVWTFAQFARPLLATILCKCGDQISHIHVQCVTYFHVGKKKIAEKKAHQRTDFEADQWPETGDFFFVFFCFMYDWFILLCLQVINLVCHAGVYTIVTLVLTLFREDTLGGRQVSINRIWVWNIYLFIIYAV